MVRSLCLFLVAALFEIGGASLVWQALREHRGWIWMVGGVVALGAYGFLATLQPDTNFGRILGCLRGHLRRWFAGLGHGRRWFPPRSPRRLGALICLAGVAVIMYAPRGQ
jgi:small multidrug resistance family-3 protein